MTTQVRPWPAGGAWNTVALDSDDVCLKTTTWGVALASPRVGVALRAVNRWVNAGGGGGPAVHAQKEAHAVGLELQEV